VKPVNYGLFPLEVPLVSVRKGFSTFFALGNADLVAFSALVLAAVAASQAFLEALSSASREEMRALAASKASVVQTKGEENRIKKTKKGIRDKQSIGKRITFRSLSSLQILDTFSAQSDKFLHQDLSEKHVSTKITQGTEEKYQDQHAHHRMSSWTDGFPKKHQRLLTSSNAWNHD
jgi:hypothetical protein